MFCDPLSRVNFVKILDQLSTPPERKTLSCSVSLSCLHIAITLHCCAGQKVALWCAKWFTEREDTNKVFVREPGQEVPSNFKWSLWINNSPRSISLLSFYFPSLLGLSGTVLDRNVYRCHCKLPWIKVYLATCFLYSSPETWIIHNKCKGCRKLIMCEDS